MYKTYTIEIFAKEKGIPKFITGLTRKIKVKVKARTEEEAHRKAKLPKNYSNYKVLSQKIIS